MEKTLKDYILTAKRQYEYRLKFAFELSEEQFYTIEKVCDRYNIIDIKKPKKIPFSKNPLDFKNGVENVEVSIVDVTVEYPASLDMLRNYLNMALKCPEKFVVVVDKNNDPYGEESKKILKTDKEIDSGEYVVKLSDPNYESDGATIMANALYGDEYNETMLKTIGDFSKEQHAEQATKSPFTNIKKIKKV